MCLFHYKFNLDRLDDTSRDAEILMPALAIRYLDYVAIIYNSMGMRDINNATCIIGIRFSNGIMILNN
jgi:hypothetical protein